MLRRQRTLNLLLGQIEESINNGDPNFDLIDRVLLDPKLRNKVKKGDLLKRFQSLQERAIDTFVENRNIKARSDFVSIDDDGLSQISDEHPTSESLGKYFGNWENFTYYIAQDILSKESREARVLAMERYVAIMEKLYSQGNFSDARAVSSALNYPFIDRLSEDQFLSDHAREVKNNLHEIFTATRSSYQTLREMTVGSAIPSLAVYKGIAGLASTGDDLLDRQDQKKSTAQNEGIEFLKKLKAQNELLRQKDRLPKKTYDDTDSVISKIKEQQRSKKMKKTKQAEIISHEDMYNSLNAISNLRKPENVAVKKLSRKENKSINAIQHIIIDRKKSKDEIKREELQTGFEKTLSELHELTKKDEGLANIEGEIARLKHKINDLENCQYQLSLIENAKKEKKKKFYLYDSEDKLRKKWKELKGEEGLKDLNGQLNKLNAEKAKLESTEEEKTRENLRKMLNIFPKISSLTERIEFIDAK